MPRIELQPAGVVLHAAAGTPLRDLLHDQVEFPCGGQSGCGGCRVRVLRGAIPINEEQKDALEPDELRAGWRLACCAALGTEDVTLDVAQWEMAVLSDAAHVELSRGGVGKAVAVDVGTTTLVAQMIDLASGEVLGVATALNPQAAYGADIMTRIEMAAGNPAGANTLRELIRHAVRDLIQSLPAAGSSGFKKVLLAGNSVMHHLYCGLPVEPFTQAPFEVTDGAAHTHRCRKLDAEMTFLGCLGGFVGSDIAAGILATGIYRSEELQVLVDLGTNGEIVVGDRRRLLCASTAAGPAFEGGRIGMGMRAASGAIAGVTVHEGRLEATVLGGGEPRGICGSGLVDAVAAGLATGAIRPNGRLATGSEWTVRHPVVLKQRDIRELQLAKGAIAAGIEVLLRRLGATVEDVTRFHLAGAFGNYVNAQSAWRIGLLPVNPQRVEAAGNTSLRGVKRALFDASPLDTIAAITEHVPLGADPQFQELFVASMGFAEERLIFLAG